MKKELTTKIYKNVFDVEENHKNVNKFVKAVVINFGDSRGDIIVKNDNFGTRRKYADFTNGKKEAGLHPLQIVFTGLEIARITHERYPDKYVIAININTVWESPVEIWWVISHELRHLWQVKNGQFNVDNYKPSQENNLKSYAMQFEEVDANAWGVYVIISLFHTRPLLENIYGEKVWQQILKRVEEIKADTVIK